MRLRILICTFFAVCVSVIQSISPELVTRYRSVDDDFLPPSGIIRKKGYPAEDHEAVTEDGYILSVTRIPFGRNSNKTSGPPVFLMHGFLSSAATWIVGDSDSTLGYQLADAGYDVWMGNVRGTLYSMKHVNKSAHFKEYWGFSIDEIGAYDIPAFIDYVLNATGHEKLYYIGHSMGTTDFFMAMAERPEYNEKIRLMIALAPVAYLTHITSLFKVLLKNALAVQIASEILGWYQFLPYDRLTAKLLSDVCCNEPFVHFTVAMLSTIIGSNPSQFNQALFPAFVAQHPSGVGLYAAGQFAQIYRTGRFQKYDFGYNINLQKYNHPNPPEYDLKKITAPVALFYGAGDVLADPQDIYSLAIQLPNLVHVHRVDHPSFNHLDFVTAINVTYYVNKPIIKLMSKF